MKWGTDLCVFKEYNWVVTGRVNLDITSNHPVKINAQGSALLSEATHMAGKKEKKPSSAHWILRGSRKE